MSKVWDITAKVEPSQGVGIASVEQTATSTESGGVNVITVTKTDATSSTFEVRNGQAGADGFSPSIAENADNTSDVYKLDVTTATGTFTTPNLMGGSGSQGAGLPSGTAGQLIGYGTDGSAAAVTPNDTLTSDGENLGVALPNRTVTRAEYDALSDEEKQSEVVYDIVDDFTSESVVLQKEHQVYSVSDEVVIGRWIDGKPLYRSAYYFSSAGGASTSGVSNDIDLLDCSGLNIDFAPLVHGVLRTPAGSSMPAGPISCIDGITYFYYVQLTAKTMLRASVNMSGTANYSLYVLMEYTKTTDTATITLPDATTMAASYAEGVQSA